MNNLFNFRFKLSILACSAAIALGCSTQKDNAANRSLQNLSARYNYIYNANVLLNQHQENLTLTHKDNYDELLPIYIAPEPDIDNTAKELGEIITKAQVIVNEKGLSNYVDEAYILLGKANFYKGNYFTAAAYFDYTASAYKKDKKMFLQALNWKARSLLALNNNAIASKVLDTVKIFLDSVKTTKAEPLATLAQLSIYQQNYAQAIVYLESAIKESNKIESRTRWPFILAQLYELEKKYNQSLKYYTTVENSNAPFEMYFNAKLGKIRINDGLKDLTSNRKAQLLKLLKDDKNLEFTDKIYFEIAEDYLADGDLINALKYYKLSVAGSTNNAYQKGLSYLKIADLNFKNTGNYVVAKLYYDSAANTLPKTYNGYERVIKLAENLAYLTDRYQIITKQDSLQLLAKLPEQERNSVLESMFAPKAQANNIIQAKSTIKEISNQGNSKFYFANTAAISKGYNDFKKRWGNRPLEDNWRQSVKSSAQINQQNLNTAIGNNTSLDAAANINTEQILAIKNYAAQIPLTQAQLLQSDQLIIEAYFEIAVFYQQVIKDESEAIRAYETLLSRYPQNNHLDAIYYSLYLAYQQIDNTKSNQYKNLVLAKFPNSLYAKTIIDPNFSAKQNALETEVKRVYNEVFAKYESKNFKDVINGVNEISARFPGNNLQIQFDYLKAIAIGRTQNIDSLLFAFNSILTNYPKDQLITPLIKDHLNYINANISTFKARSIALVDFDGTEPRFITQQEKIITPSIATIANNTIDNTKSTAIKQQSAPKSVVKPNEKPPIIEPKTNLAKDSLNKPLPLSNQKDSVNLVTPKAPIIDNLFSKAESDTYYYVIAVTDVSVSVSSSRFGVGQFNRGNFAGAGIKHQLLELDEDQLIYVGNFNNLNDVKSYSENIQSELAKIMKVPAGSYSSFYISKENFEKIKNRDTLNRYIAFFKLNY